MGSVAEMYINGVKSKMINYFAAWLPSTPLKLGDYGLLNKNLFTRLGSLSDLGIPFEILDDPDSTPIDIVSNSGVSMSLKFAGAINPKLPNIPEAEAGIGIEFGKQGAFVVQAEQSYEPAIKNIAGVQREVLQALKNKKWNPKWAVIVSQVNTPTATIIISNSRTSKVEIMVKGGAELSSIRLASSEFSYSMVAQKGDLIRMINAKNVTPFFKLARVKEHMFKPDEVTTLAAGTELSPFDAHAPDFGELTPDQRAHFFFDQIVDSDEW